MHKALECAGFFTRKHSAYKRHKFLVIVSLIPIKTGKSRWKQVKTGENGWKFVKMFFLKPIQTVKTGQHGWKYVKNVENGSNRSLWIERGQIGSKYAIS